MLFFSFYIVCQAMWVKDGLHIMWRSPSPSVPFFFLFFLPSLLSSLPLEKKEKKKHPPFEGCDGKSERLKQSASKLACQKALNQYPQLPTTQPCSPLTLPPPRPTLPFPPSSSGCFLLLLLPPLHPALAHALPPDLLLAFSVRPLSSRQPPTSRSSSNDERVGGRQTHRQHGRLDGWVPAQRRLSAWRGHGWAARSRRGRRLSSASLC